MAFRAMSQNSRTHTFRWRPSAATEPPTFDLTELARDRVTPARELVRQASERLAHGLPSSAGRDLTSTLERALAPFEAAHGWRGTVAGWLATIREAAKFDGDPAEALAEELGLWAGGADDRRAERAWDGAALSPGTRLPERSLCAPALVSRGAGGPRDGALGLARGEAILVHGDSETVAVVLEEVQSRGLAPHVLVTEGGPDLSGRRLAARLAARGLPVTYMYDLAALDAVRRADRVWVGTESIGAADFLGRVGTRALLEEARRLEVPTSLVATSDKLMPLGALVLPAFDENWLLWERAPEGVRIESAFYEAVPLELVDCLATEVGLESAAELSLRCLRTSRVS